MLYKSLCKMSFDSEKVKLSHDTSPLSNQKINVGE